MLQEFARIGADPVPLGHRTESDLYLEGAVRLFIRMDLDELLLFFEDIERMEGPDIAPFERQRAEKEFNRKRINGKMME